MSESDSSIDTDNVSLSDSIKSYTPEDRPRKEVVDMSRWRDNTLTKEILKSGKGWSTPKTGTEVSIHYVAKKEDGTIFDSSRDQNRVFTFIVGRKQVVKGLDIAIKTMKWSEISRFTFAREYSFNESDCPHSLTPGERVTYEVELFYFKLMDLSKKKDGALTKRIIEPGIGFDLPIFGSEVTLDIVGKYKNRVFDERNVIFNVGEAENIDLIPGIDIVATRMRKQEKCRLFAKPEYAFGPKGNERFEIPEDYEQLVYDIHLIDFTKGKEPFELQDSEKLEESKALKRKANNYFNESKYGLAINQYKRMIKILRYDSSKDLGFKVTSNMNEEEFTQKRDKLLYIAYQNLSNSYYKLENFDSCLKWIENALKLEPTNAKGLYRKGMAYFSLQEYEIAMESFQKSLQSDPNNKSAQNYVIHCKNAIKTRIQTERELYSKYFTNDEMEAESLTESFENIEINPSGDDLQESFESEKDTTPDENSKQNSI